MNAMLHTWARLLGGEVHGVQVLCPGPGHSASDRSLSVKIGKDGQPVVHSHAGDDWQTCRDYARRRLGMEPFKPDGRRKTVAAYEFCDPATGDVRYRKERVEAADGTKSFFFKPAGRNGGEPLLYGGERLADLAEGQPVFIVEGEKKVARLRELGAVAVSGDSGASSKWLPAHAGLLRGLNVVIWPDSDLPGEKYAVNAAKCLEGTATSIRVVRPFGPPNGAKGLDVCDWTGNGVDLAALAAGAGVYAEREQKPVMDKPRVLDPKAPYTTAKLFLENYVQPGGARTIHHHRGAFYIWNGRAYLERADGELRAELYPFLDRSFSKDRAGISHPVKPNAAMVTNVVDGMRAVAAIDGSIAAPAWLHQVSPWAADEIVACANGLLHLPSGNITGNTPEFFTYNALDFPFDANAPEPKLFLAFLHELWDDDPESISTLQEIFGYCLTGDTNQQKAFLLVGPRRSGKGTIARVLARLIGDDNRTAPTLAGLGTNFGIAPLIGKRVAIISDARLGARADQHAIAERILSITGEDAITVDRKYAPAWTGQLQTRFVVISNELPRLADASGALASRFIVLLLTKSFYGREDHALTSKLLTELPGILNWAIAGWHRLANFGRFKQPTSAIEAVEQLEDLGSPIGAFIREKCERGAFEVSVDRIFQAWCEWCSTQGRDHHGTKQSFGRDLRAACPGQTTGQRGTDHDKDRVYKGIGIKPSYGNSNAQGTRRHA